MDDNQKLEEMERRLKDAEEFMRKCSEDEMYLRQAAEIQKSILPERSPLVPGYDIAAMMQPARWVGGDFYDYFPNFSGPDTYGIMVGDISDKGFPAASYMFMGHGMVHAGLSLKRFPSAESLLQWLNTRILEVSKNNMFVTLTYGVLDSREHTFSYARAGHTQPYLFDSEGGTIYCGDSKRGQPLGILSHPDLASGVIGIPPAGMIALYSDGLADETGPENCAFGMERLERLIAENRGLSAEGICKSVMDELKAYREGARPYDDCTIMIIKRDG